MVADVKKNQTLINVYLDAYQQVQAINAAVQAKQALYDAQTPSQVGSPLQGKAAALNGWVATLNTISSNPTLDSLLVDYVPTHRGTALG